MVKKYMNSDRCLIKLATWCKIESIVRCKMVEMSWRKCKEVKVWKVYERVLCENLKCVETVVRACTRVWEL